MPGKVQYKDDLSNRFLFRGGVKQGCVLPTTLFGIYLSFLFRQAVLSVFPATKASLRVQELAVRELLYADNAALYTSSASELQCLFDVFSPVCKGIEPTISFKKMVVLSQSFGHCQAPHIWCNFGKFGEFYISQRNSRYKHIFRQWADNQAPGSFDNLCSHRECGGTDT